MAFSLASPSWFRKVPRVSSMKTANDWAQEELRFFFLDALNVPRRETRVNIEGRGQTKLTASLAVGPVIVSVLFGVPSQD